MQDASLADEYFSCDFNFGNPSGHTFQATTFTLTLVFLFLGKMKWNYALFMHPNTKGRAWLVPVYLFIFLMAASRVFVGAHTIN